MKLQPKTAVIYTLYAFDGKGPRYCGFTSYPVKRFREHKIDKSKKHKCNWVKSVGPENIHMSILEITTPEKAPEREIFYIKKLRAMGFDLTNHTDGGEGLLNPSPETRAKMSASKKGKKFLPEHCANIAKAKRNISPETRVKMSYSQQHKVVTAEHKAKISASLIGNTRTKGYKHTPEAIAKLSAASKGRVWSAESRAKLSASKMGNKSKTGQRGCVYRAREQSERGA
jgi:predicted GIY-YIG superfamily endonuclease